MESDWKKFRALVPELRERYIAKCNAAVLQEFTAPGKTETERFWHALHVMEKEAKILRYCIDGHSRSKMQLFIHSMVGAGMMTKEDLAGFSDELQQQIAYVFDEKG